MGELTAGTQESQPRERWQDEGFERMSRMTPPENKNKNTKATHKTKCRLRDIHCTSLEKNVTLNCALKIGSGLQVRGATFTNANPHMHPGQLP